MVVITSTGGVTKQRYTFSDPVDPGLVTWAGDYLRERLTGLRLRSRLLARAFGEPGFSARVRASLNWTMPEFVKRSVGSPCGTSDELRTRR